MTPISSIWLSASSSLKAAKSAPVIARPVMPSCPAMAAPVTAWSPVIMRIWMPAERALAMEALASGRGGSTIPTSASIVKSFTWESRSLDGSKLAGSKSRRATAITRKPCLPSRSLFSVYSLRTTSIETSSCLSSRLWVERASNWSGAPLTKQRITSCPSSLFIRWNVAISI